MNRITQQQLESYLWGAAVLLRGTIDAGDYKQLIFPLLFYKRICDAFDEETQVALAESGGDKKFAAYPENHRFQVPSKAHWREIRKVSSNVGRALQNAMRDIETANPDKLYGIFGDAQWTNKDRLSDTMLRDLIEHFSSLELTIASLPEDELGQGYEYLIKKFADDSGHTAAEFYTNRTVVHLMTEMLQPQPSESIYDPTCGSGGMLLSAISHLRRHKKEWRNVRLFGQERNLMTSSIARMNCFLHGIEDFRIERGDTLSEPKLVQGDRLMKFDVVLANPPYSIKQWDRESFASDPWGRNLCGTPPQGRADYAFWQHILQSLKANTGRCAILFPHGVLFRQEEADMRRKMVEADVIECVLGLGPNLFYNSPMEACIVICRAAKPKARKGKILLINAVGEVTRERAQSFLTKEHIKRIVKSYESFKEEPGFTHVATIEEIRAKDGNLSIPLYIAPLEPRAEKGKESTKSDLKTALSDWLESSQQVNEALAGVLKTNASSFSKPHPNPAWAALPLFDRVKWQKVRFGDVVENLNETCVPAEAGIERYIGLEHLEPGSLHIRTWGSVADGVTFNRRCKPGQVLFGKRRAYQRKVAVAEFDAVVSGDIYVFAAKKDRLTPELLPFLCMSDRFFKYAVETSAGSLSPRTNWSSLADFEFVLPPLDQQMRMAKMLWIIDSSSNANETLAKKVNQTREAFIEDIGSNPNGKYCTQLLGEIAAVTKLAGYEFTKLMRYISNGEIIAIRALNIKNRQLDLTDIQRISREASLALPRSKINADDILITYIGAYIGDILRITESDKYHLAPNVAKITAGHHILPELLEWLLRTRRVQQQMRNLTTTTATPSLTMTQIRNLRICFPRDASDQHKALTQINFLDETTSLITRAKKRLDETGIAFREEFMS